MTDDLLSQATRALRDETADDGASGRFTRARIMASAHDRRVWKRTRVAFLIPIAATFVAASAVGATGGPKRALDAVARVFGLHVDPPPAPAAPPPRRSEPPRSASRAEAPPPEAAVAPEVPPEVPPPVSEAPAPAVVATTNAGNTAGRTAGSAGAGATDPNFDLYRVAHRAHFVEHDSERALAAWDSYLRAAPRGAFALEARYNRALCLVRLDRKAEARAALTPFAEGRYGGYRKDDATKLIAALPAEP